MAKRNARPITITTTPHVVRVNLAARAQDVRSVTVHPGTSRDVVASALERAARVVRERWQNLPGVNPSKLTGSEYR